MKPFKMFFGLAIGIIIFLFLARIAVVAFVIAGIMSIIYAVYRRVKDFITYDRYGDYYVQAYAYPEMEYQRSRNVEPLFRDHLERSNRPIRNIQFIETA